MGQGEKKKFSFTINQFIEGRIAKSKELPVLPIRGMTSVIALPEWARDVIFCNVILGCLVKRETSSCPV